MRSSYAWEASMNRLPSRFDGVPAAAAHRIGMAGHRDAPPGPTHDGHVELLQKRGCHLSVGNVEEKGAGVAQSRVDQKRYPPGALTSSLASG